MKNRNILRGDFLDVKFEGVLTSKQEHLSVLDKVYVRVLRCYKENLDFFFNQQNKKISSYLMTEERTFSFYLLFLLQKLLKKPVSCSVVFNEKEQCYF